jgi:hypothetical protein
MAEELILEKRTVEVLRNFAAINSGIAIDPGNVLRVIHPRKHLVARVRIPQEITMSFAIWDLGRFLAALEMFPKPKLILDGNGQMEIRDVESTDGGLVLRYPLTNRDCVDPVREPHIDPSVVFPLSKERLKLFLNLTRQLDVPHLVLTGDGTSITLGAADVNKGSSEVSGSMPVGNSRLSFRVVFAVEDWRLLLDEDYHVGIALRDADSALGYFIGANGKVHYWIASRLI